MAVARTYVGISPRDVHPTAEAAMFQESLAYSGFSVDNIAPAKDSFAETDVAGISRGGTLIDRSTEPGGNILSELQEV